MIEPSFRIRAALAVLACSISLPFLSAPLRAQVLPNTLSLSIPEGAFSVIDATGREIKFDRFPRRILAIGPSAEIVAQAVYMFPPGRERLVGLEPGENGPSGFLAVLDPDWPKKIVLSAGASAEQIAALKPDLFLARVQKTDATIGALSALKIPVVYLGMTSPEQYERDLSNLGAILAAKERADEIIAFFRGRYGRVLLAVSGIATAAKPRVLVARYAAGSPASLEIPPAGGMPSVQARSAGGIPVWEDEAGPGPSWTGMSARLLPRWNPDVIILVVRPPLDPGAALAEFKASHRAEDLRALQSGQIHAFPADLSGWDTNGPRWILGLLWMAAKLHPASFRDLDMDKELDEFFRVLFGMDKASIDAKIRPALRGSLR